MQTWPSSSESEDEAERDLVVEEREEEEESEEEVEQCEQKEEQVGKTKVNLAANQSCT